MKAHVFGEIAHRVILREDIRYDAVLTEQLQEARYERAPNAQPAAIVRHQDGHFGYLVLVNERVRYAQRDLPLEGDQPQHIGRGRDVRRSARQSEVVRREEKPAVAVLRRRPLEDIHVRIGMRARYWNYFHLASSFLHPPLTAKAWLNLYAFGRRKLVDGFARPKATWRCPVIK